PKPKPEPLPEPTLLNDIEWPELLQQKIHWFQSMSKMKRIKYEARADEFRVARGLVVVMGRTGIRTFRVPGHASNEFLEYLTMVGTAPVEVQEVGGEKESRLRKRLKSKRRAGIGDEGW
ncbi:hypothetical protein HDU98_007892, partial [Podochytrium sp. JEL0797]